MVIEYEEPNAEKHLKKIILASAYTQSLLSLWQKTNVTRKLFSCTKKENNMKTTRENSLPPPLKMMGAFFWCRVRSRGEGPDKKGEKNQGKRREMLS